ncbi:adenomatous polyposis coli protein-like [Microcaecilia unicolor]|uniref:Adenomatous polyposis coli protein-like n=1 Tax=Microcaecilia unicolor TaxID=1415580 RepID=A0A6P7XGF7_9AMPH|nr:adenomatous polyposis coli protein-like [Microcaecilia unicolor]
MQTYCVEDTPICFSRCSSLSSLSSAEDEIGYCQETPLMFSRCTSVSSLDSFEIYSVVSSVQSESCSGMLSGIISPSDLPDSPGQTMPPSRSKTPPQTLQLKKEAAKNKEPPTEKRESGPKRSTINAAVQRVHVLPYADTLLYFASESTPDGFSCASSLSALSLDEPYIPKDTELRIMPPVHEHDHGSDGESEKAKDANYCQEKREEKPFEPEKDILDESDDDIDLLEECIFSAMPTQSLRKK